MKMQYDVWQIRCDVRSEWDGGQGKVVESVFSEDEARKAVKEYQIGGHAAWYEEST